MTPETRREILDALLLGGATHPGHAYEILDDLEAAAGRYESDARIQSEAREAAPRERRGRPTDVAERQFEARVLTILDAHGVSLADTEHGPAPTILALLRETTSDPRNALRRAKRRIRALAALTRYLELRDTRS